MRFLELDDAIEQAVEFGFIDASVDASLGDKSLAQLLDDIEFA